jgi:hypothetical protein
MPSKDFSYDDDDNNDGDDIPLNSETRIIGNCSGKGNEKK